VAPVTRSVTEQLVTEFYDVLWNRWDDGAVDAVLAEDFVFRGSLGNEALGRDAWRGYRDLIRASSSDFHNQIEALVVDGHRAAARLRYTGTHDGPLAGVPPTGRRFSYGGAAFFEACGAQLAGAWVLGDLAGLRAQLTAGPPPPGTSTAPPNGAEATRRARQRAHLATCEERT
jgi:steroid delta-isomerase-like uncharacterized protein